MAMDGRARPPERRLGGRYRLAACVARTNGVHSEQTAKRGVV